MQGFEEGDDSGFSFGGGDGRKEGYDEERLRRGLPAWPWLMVIGADVGGELLKKLAF